MMINTGENKEVNMSSVLVGKSNKKRLNLCQSINLSPTMYIQSLDDEDSYSDVFVF